MGNRQGVQAEVLLSLALVMVTGTALLAAVFLEINHARVESLHGLLGRGFVAQSRDPSFEVRPGDIGIWWRIDLEGRVSGLNASAELIDEGTRALAVEVARTGAPVIQSGAPWEPIRFAASRQAGRGVIAGRIDAAVSGAVIIVLLVTDVLIFGLFGVTLLRRRVVGPLHRLALGVREIGVGSPGITLPVEGIGEIAELGTAFNEMQKALASRTGALEKAVLELRGANASLMQAREGLDRAERLAMVGSLAAGVAHEVGNPMGELLAFLDVAARDEGLGEEGRRCLGRASEQGERVRVILRQLLDFSRPPQVEHGPIELGPLAQQAVELVSAQKPFSEIEFSVEVEEGAPLAMGDAGLVSQILLNLAINAAATLAGQPIRRIRLEIAGDRSRRRVGDDDRSGAAAAGNERVDSVVCRVGDSGPGVGQDEAGRIFDPFFTTKPPGEGTGLGLANVRRLALEMGGSVELDPERSELGGALFHFRLPIGEQASSEEAEEVTIRGAGSGTRASHGSRNP